MLSFKNIVDIREPHEHNQVSFSTVFSSYKEEKKKKAWYGENGNNHKRREISVQWGIIFGQTFLGKPDTDPELNPRMD